MPLTRAQRKRARHSTLQDVGPVHHYATLLDLPVELLFHIASIAYPQCHVFLHSLDPDAQLYFERLDALRALSQTSKALRPVFLPLAWECLESYYARHNSENNQSAYLTDKLQRLTQGLLLNPNLAAYVRFAFIYIPTCSTPRCLIPCLVSLRNLHTLRYEREDMDSFSYRPSCPTLPSVRTLVVDHFSSQYFLPRCPKVKAVISCMGASGAELRGVLDEKEKSLEELDGFTLNEQDVEYITQAAPNLRRIKFTAWVPREIIQSLHPLTRLQSISMTARGYTHRPIPIAETDAWVATAVNVLRGNECSSADKDGKGKKRVKMDCTWVDYSNEMAVIEKKEDVEVE